jgi:hypothetical protein
MMADDDKNEAEPKAQPDKNQPEAAWAADMRKLEDKLKGWVRYELDLAARGIQRQERMEKFNP